MKELKVKDVIKKTPKQIELNCYMNIDDFNWIKGFNKCRFEILNSPVDITKVLDVEKIKTLIYNKVEYDITTHFGCLQLAQAIIDNINNCMKDKCMNENEQSE